MPLQHMPCCQGPAASVIIPAYNAGVYLARAIESVLAQNLRDLELIVIDDASSDNTYEVAAKYAPHDSRLKVLPNQRNAGPGAARNRGFDEARGRWIAILDADDAFLLERLEVLIRLGESTGADLVADNLMLGAHGAWRPDRLAFSRDQLPEGTPIDAAHFVANDMPYGPPGLSGLKQLMRRSFREEHAIRYEEDFPMGEDFLIIMHCFAAGGRFVTTHRSYYGYTMRADSHSRGDRSIWPSWVKSNERAVELFAHRNDRRLLKLLERRRRVLSASVDLYSLREALRKRQPGTILRQLSRLAMNEQVYRKYSKISWKKAAPVGCARACSSGWRGSWMRSICT